MEKRVIKYLLEQYMIASDDECSPCYADCERAVALSDALLLLTGLEPDQLFSAT